MTPIGEVVVELWIKEYRKHPAIMTVATCIVVAIAVGTIIISNRLRSEKAEHVRNENLTYHKQIEALNVAERNMRGLIEFIEAEKGRLKKTEDVLSDLKKEKDALTPVVEADRKTVRAIFDLQAKMSRQAIWWDRSIAFGMGIVASLFGSFGYGVFRYGLRKRVVTDPVVPGQPPKVTQQSISVDAEDGAAEG